MSLKPATPQSMYDVRSATVVADATIPPAPPMLLSATNERVNAAIAATTRNTELPKVALTIRITDIQKGQGFNQDRNTAKINIDAASVESGAVLAIASFNTTTFAVDPTIADNLMAEDIAARVRSTFVLKTPPLGG